MEFVDYNIGGQLIWTSGECCINKNLISIEVSPKAHINKVDSTSILGVGCYFHMDTCAILSEDLVSSGIQAYS